MEFKLQFQEDVIESLNQALANQQQYLLQLQEKLALLGKQVEFYRQQQGIQQDDLPPHY